MARVSVFYDKDIKEQVFMVRGDERYTHATKTIIELGDTGDQDVYGFVQEIHVNVLRDYGDSSIIIYDNDVALTVIDDWTSTDTGRTIELPPITWDTPHKIQAKYIGNGRCSPSMSNVLEIPAIPNEYKTDAELLLAVNYPTQSDTFTFQVEAYFEDSPEGDVGSTIEFFLDDVSAGTVDIDSETHKAVKDFSDVEDGLHTVKVRFDGSVELYAKTTTQNISVGTKLTLLSKPTIFVTGGVSSFRVKATNYLDEAISGATIVAKYHDSEDSSITFDTETTNSNGIATLSNTIPSDIGDGTIYFYDSNSNLLSSVKLPQFTPTTLTMTPTTERLYKNQNTGFSVNVGQNIEGVPVTFKEIASDDSTTVISTTTANTNTKGIATFTVRGKGEQNRIFKAEVGAVTLTDWFEDYSQYWEANNIVNRDYTLIGGQLLDLASGFQIYPTVSSQDVSLSIFFEKNKPYAVYLENVYSTNSKGTVVDIHFDGFDSNNYKLKANHSNIWIFRHVDGTVSVMDSGGNSYNIPYVGSVPARLIFHQKTTFSKLTTRETDHDTLVIEEE